MSPTQQPIPAHPLFHLLFSGHHHFPHSNMHTQSPAFASHCSGAGGGRPILMLSGNERGDKRTASP